MNNDFSLADFQHLVDSQPMNFPPLSDSSGHKIRFSGQNKAGLVETLSDTNFLSLSTQGATVQSLGF